MDLNQWFEKGMTPDDYIASMKTHKNDLLHIHEQFMLPDDDAFFTTLQTKNLRVIVLTEDWCGDAMLNIPILLNLSKKINMPVRMLLRDNNLELMDHYLTNGKSRSIPIFIFIDGDGKERATWGPRAETVQQFSDEMREKLPATDAVDYKEQFKEFVAAMNHTFQNDSTVWDDVYKSIKDTLQDV